MQCQLIRANDSEEWVGLMCFFFGHIYNYFRRRRDIRPKHVDTLISHILFENYRSVDMQLFYMSVVLGLLSACHMIRSTCHELFFPEDAEFCKGGLKVIYPDMIIDKCLIVPQKDREKISKEWGPPQVQLQGVKEKSKYSLIMVDPDAPSRKKPSRAYWRHWLLVGIQGNELMSGDISGTELSEYTRPTPPKGTGLHRYQFLVFEQPEDQIPSLSPQEKSSLGNWDPQAFVQRFGLTGPVASLQFLTQNHKD